MTSMAENDCSFNQHMLETFIIKKPPEIRKELNKEIMCMSISMYP